MEDYSNQNIHLHSISRSHTSDQLTRYPRPPHRQTKIDIVAGSAARRQHRKHPTRQMHREISEEFRVEKIRKCEKKGKNTHDRARRGEESRLAWCNAASRTSRWLHHVLDLPCRSSWRPSSLARITRDSYKRLSSCVCRHETDDPTISDISLHGDRSPPRRSDESCDVSEFVIVSIRLFLSTRVHGTPLSRLRLDIVSVRSPREMSRNFFPHNRL